MNKNPKDGQKAEDGITISARCGKIRGITSTSDFSGKMYYSFLGIPYAVPPVGHLRFEPPMPFPRFFDIFNANTNKECIQFSLFEHIIVGSEDCLYLNVHIPEAPIKKKTMLPVVVNIHFGGFLWGSGSTQSCGSPNFVIHQGIVYVTITFRLNVFGFLCLNTDLCAGNMGLKDIVMALRWVHQNIKFFGGDPNNVTLLGSSSGSMQIHQLMMIRACKGLFHKVVLMGMYALHPFVHFPPDPVQVAFKLARAMNFTGQSLTDLYNFLKYAPIASFLKALLDVNAEMSEEVKKYMISSSFLPVYGSIDGFLPATPENILKIENPVPVIYGICENEALTLFLPKYRRFFEEDISQVLDQNYNLWLHQLNNNQMRQIEKEVHRRYGVKEITTPCRATSDLAATEFYHTLADIMQNDYPEISLYIYKFQYKSVLNPFTNLVRDRCDEKLEGSFHADDVFYWMARDYGKPLSNSDKSMVELLTTVFCNFAKTGNPNKPDRKLRWEASTKENPCYICITGNEETSTMVNERLNADGVLFWEDLKKKFAKDIDSSD